jgi:Protein of unknown function (DUF2795)
MERASDKHGPRLDEELQHETRSLERGAPLAARVEEARFLTPSAFPVDREALLADAEGNHAPAEVLERLRALPAGRTFQNVQDVWRALGGAVEHRF